MIRKKRTELTVIGTRQGNPGRPRGLLYVEAQPRARFARLEIRRETGLTVVVPKSYRWSRSAAFSKLRAAGYSVSWRGAEAPALSPESDLKTGDEIPYLGGSLQIVKRAHEAELHPRSSGARQVGCCPRLRGSRAERGGRVVVPKAGRMVDRGPDRQLGAQMGLAYNRITIRGQRSRWGSCSRTGNLKLQLEAHHGAGAGHRLRHHP